MMRKMLLTLLLLLLAGLRPAVGEVCRTLTAFAPESDTGWQLRDGGNLPLSPQGAEISLQPGQSLELFRTVSDWNRDWPLEATHLCFTFRLPHAMPVCHLRVYAKDNDFLWRETSCQLGAGTNPPQDGQWQLALPIKDRPAVAAWTPLGGHTRPWTALTARNLLELGLVFALPADATPATFWLTDIALEKRAVPAASAPVYDFAVSPKIPQASRRCELTFRLAKWPLFPCNQKTTDIRADITAPDGSTVSRHAFYFEDFLYDSQERDKTRCLTPAGEPCYKIRFLPRQAGPHAVVFHAQVDGQELSLPPLTIEVSAAPDGAEPVSFIVCDPEHHEFLQFDDGRYFWGLGVNMRSPFDNRYFEIAPYSQWLDLGLGAYDLLFPKFRKHGINVVETWMSSWWLALEWINDAPGFHGVGHYNQYRAWMLDHILGLAEANNIRLIIPFNNHGKFGDTYDTEWARNPYNVKNGGFLQKSSDYYTDAKAQEAFRRTADYIVARWSASTAILAWKLFTEVDLTGPDLNFYRQPQVAAWHHLMGSYLHEIDAYKHPVTTHWMLGYHRINDDIALVPELDLLTTDAYYQKDGTKGLVNLLVDGARVSRKWDKPLLITEFGGSSYGDNMECLVKQVELGSWVGLFHQAPVVPLNWWFAMLEDKNLYHHFDSIAAYAAQEDRRQLKPSELDLPDQPFHACFLQGEKRLLCWLYDTVFFYDDRENVKPKLREDVTLQLPPLMPGEYAVEFWDTAQGKISRTETFVQSSAEEQQTLTLPPFRRTTALKIFPK